MRGRSRRWWLLCFAHCNNQGCELPDIGSLPEILSNNASNNGRAEIDENELARHGETPCDLRSNGFPGDRSRRNGSPPPALPHTRPPRGSPPRPAAGPLAGDTFLFLHRRETHRSTTDRDSDSALLYPDRLAHGPGPKGRPPCWVERGTHNERTSRSSVG